MDTGALIRGLLLFVAFIPLVTLHEFAHAWVATRCGDDTPRLQGRVTLDPLAHIDLIGTIVLPLILTLIGAFAGNALMFGWGRPVQVNPNNFNHRRLDDILVSAAGPAMNLVIGFWLIALMKIMDVSGGGDHVNDVLPVIRLSIFLCFFNLLPVPPLDGGHIMRNLLNISDEVYQMMSQYSFMFLVIIFRIPAIGGLVTEITDWTLYWFSRPFGWHYSVS